MGDYKPTHRRRFYLRWRDGRNDYVGRHRRVSFAEALAAHVRHTSDAIARVYFGGAR